MKQFLLPVALLCFTMASLVFIHIDNMNKLNEEKAMSKTQDIEIHSQPKQ